MNGSYNQKFESMVSDFGVLGCFGVFNFFYLSVFIFCLFHFSLFIFIFCAAVVHPSYFALSAWLTQWRA